MEKTGEDGHTGGETEHPNREGMQTKAMCAVVLRGLVKSPCEGPIA